MADTTRPTPLRDAARIWSLVAGSVSSVASFLVTNQVLAAGQAESLTNASASVNVLLSAVVGVIAGVGGVVGAFGTAKQSEPQVTPKDDPRAVDAHGFLVPLVPVDSQGRTDVAQGGGL